MAVPERLRKHIGKSEFKYSLETIDPDVARHRHAVKLAEVRALMTRHETEALNSVITDAEAIFRKGLSSCLGRGRHADPRPSPDGCMAGKSTSKRTSRARQASAALAAASSCAVDATHLLHACASLCDRRADARRQHLHRHHPAADQAAASSRGFAWDSTGRREARRTMATCCGASAGERRYDKGPKCRDDVLLPHRSSGRCE